MDAWIGGSSAYCCPALKGFINNPVWDADPVHKPYARASETLRPTGHAGPDDGHALGRGLLRCCGATGGWTGTAGCG